jgi:hypothetical protein
MIALMDQMFFRIVEPTKRGRTVNITIPEKLANAMGIKPKSKTEPADRVMVAGDASGGVFYVVDADSIADRQLIAELKTFMTEIKQGRHPKRPTGTPMLPGIEDAA